MEQQKNYFAVIPASVRYDKRLKPLARLLYGEITALCNEKRYCWASNSYFAELYETTNETISRYISQLKEYGYIKIDYNKAEQNIEKRKIYIAQRQYCQNNQDGIDRTVKGVLTEKSRQYCQNNQDGIDRTVKQNNTENITNNNTEKEKPDGSPPSFDLFVKELCVVFESFTAKTAAQLHQLDGFKSPQKQDELRTAFNTRRYDWVSCVKLAKKSVESKNKDLATRWLGFLSYLRIFLKNGDEKNHSIKRHYTAEELAELEIKRKQAELEKKQREAEEERKQKEIDKIEAKKLGMTLEEYYDYIGEGGSFFEDIKKAIAQKSQNKEKANVQR
ncbi:helix-turn-helix domain-containing protein [Brachyspira intermedia]|uniref:helix-turn-helix domain-containing protein n=1 Tax=Brachyspira intermedia TaxID=84377 RepID=UPI0030065E37